MSNYTLEIRKLISSALEEVAIEHQSGRLVNGAKANNLFLVRWVTKALKSQHFSKQVSEDLVRWQKQGRSKGHNSDLMSTFKRIDDFYAYFFPEGDQEWTITDKSIDKFLDMMEQSGWEVSTSEPLVNCGKVQIFTEGPNSLALCSNQCDDCFDGAELVRPMSLFVRGHHADFVEKASAAGFMVHKVTDYKSNVKYHGEYLIFPGNLGNQLAEIPINFNA
ncbi:DUF2913 family protein [Vibrio caribbeanicus]|uniref:Alpha-acetolactate decarboxylase n=1 Tax=Vibrio caribbeanicus ATCC BAA-2122 TaxID=796620 RepID=E3BQC5_9VIBR|nr:DUF2913 family protein [Vibrio caribbeanicus]EFP94749.1 hypothetical protein VIBC2010_13531 [Vibrio caribbeanicus ATCC BAA-2122]